MGEYEVLGVARDATDAEIRRAYLRLAREHHPDLWADRDPRARERAEVRMREVNAAWAVLGDPDRRRRYDLTLPDGPVARGAGPSRPVVQPPPDRPFRPIHEHDEDDDDRWRYEPDDGVPGTGPGRALAMAPVVMFAGGFLVLVAGALLASPGVLVTGVITMVLSAVAFLMAPMAVMIRSAQAEQRTSAGARRRSKGRGRRR